MGGFIFKPHIVCHDDQVRLPQMSDIEGRWIIELIEEIEAALASLE